MAQSLLPQFSILYMKHKISFLSSRPFWIENGEVAEIRIGPYEVESFSKEYIVLQFYSFKILFYSSSVERDAANDTKMRKNGPAVSLSWKDLFGYIHQQHNIHIWYHGLSINF